MGSGQAIEATADALARDLRAYIASEVERLGLGTAPINPGNRVAFHWPPHPISYSFHIHPTEWRGKAEVEIRGETFPVQVATTPHGVFGRCEPLWLEAKGDTKEQMLAAMKEAAEPLFRRQYAIAECLGSSRRFTGHIRDLGNLDLLKLLYCPDRDVAHEAQTDIELRASEGVFLPALIEILRDQTHPYRRSAQWCVLDLFEDLKAFCKRPQDAEAAVQAIRDLIWNSPDDYARATYKAGVVLGGHFPAGIGGNALLECLSAPSPIGRRSAIHGLFHVVEWEPSLRDDVVAAIRRAAASEPEPLLKEYAELMALDIEKGEYDHVPEPVLPFET